MYRPVSLACLLSVFLLSVCPASLAAVNLQDASSLNGGKMPVFDHFVKQVHTVKIRQREG